MHRLKGEPLVFGKLAQDATYSYSDKLDNAYVIQNNKKPNPMNENPPQLRFTVPVKVNPFIMNPANLATERVLKIRTTADGIPLANSGLGEASELQKIKLEDKIASLESLKKQLAEEKDVNRKSALNAAIEQLELDLNPSKPMIDLLKQLVDLAQGVDTPVASRRGSFTESVALESDVAASGDSTAIPVKKDLGEDEDKDEDKEDIVPEYVETGLTEEQIRDIMRDMAAPLASGKSATKNSGKIIREKWLRYAQGYYMIEKGISSPADIPPDFNTKVKQKFEESKSNLGQTAVRQMVRKLYGIKKSDSKFDGDL